MVSGDLAPSVPKPMYANAGTGQYEGLRFDHLGDDHYYCLQGQFDEELVVLHVQPILEVGWRMSFLN